MDMKILYYIWLSTKLYAGSVSPKILLEHYKDIEKIFHATFDEYRELGIGKGDAKRLCDKTLDDATKYYEYCVKERIGILCYDNPYYPERLKCISDPPPMFYYKGRVEMLDDFPCFAIVGTRGCSENGYRTAYNIGYKAAVRGAVPINGVAKGIDGAVLTGALDADGYAVALLGCGIDRVYPEENRELFKRLARQGLILTEFAPFTRPNSSNFPIRNRVMSGLSLGAVIIEADFKSGALRTAEHAYAQGRRIYAVPGDINNKLYEVPLDLIKKGATPVTDADDFVSEYALMFPHRINMKSDATVDEQNKQQAVDLAFATYEIKQKSKDNAVRKLTKRSSSNESNARPKGPKYAQKLEQVEQAVKTEEQPPIVSTDLSVLSVHEKAIYSLFEKSDILTVDEIASKGIKIEDVLSSLTMLEIYGFVKSLPGGRYEKC